MQPFISIIVPCYNVEKYLDRCLNSLVHQSLQNIEIILVDDGSPDKVPQICDSWMQKDARIRVVHKRNAGLGFARNSGLEVASGEYIAFVDSDDYVETRMYETLYNIAKEKELDALFCGFRKEYALHKYHNVQECTAYTEFFGANILKLIPNFIASEPYCKSEYKYEMSVWHSIYKNSVIKNASLQFVSERDFASEDIPFQIDFLMNSQKIAFIPDIFYVYCWNGGSLTKKVSKAKFESIKHLYKLLKEKSVKFDPQTMRAKRLFIGYMRSYVRAIVQMQNSFIEKLDLIRYVMQDDIWKEISSYKPSYLPLHQRIFSYLFFIKNPILVYSYAKMMEFAK